MTRKTKPYVRKVSRECVACQAPQPSREAPDPCLGWLPGVQFACCGHGNERQAYVVESEDNGATKEVSQLPDGSWRYVLRGDAARDRMRELGGDPAEARPCPEHAPRGARCLARCEWRPVR